MMSQRCILVHTLITTYTHIDVRTSHVLLYNYTNCCRVCVWSTGHSGASVRGHSCKCRDHILVRLSLSLSLSLSLLNLFLLQMCTVLNVFLCVLTAKCPTSNLCWMVRISISLLAQTYHSRYTILFRGGGGGEIKKILQYPSHYCNINSINVYSKCNIMLLY
jgi:hypothetical protein